MASNGKDHCLTSCSSEPKLNETQGKLTEHVNQSASILVCLGLCDDLFPLLVVVLIVCVGASTVQNQLLLHDACFEGKKSLEVMSSLFNRYVQLPSPICHFLASYTPRAQLHSLAAGALIPTTASGLYHMIESDHAHVCIQQRTGQYSVGQKLQRHRSLLQLHAYDYRII